MNTIAYYCFKNLYLIYSFKAWVAKTSWQLTAVRVRTYYVQQHFNRHDRRCADVLHSSNSSTSELPSSEYLATALQLLLSI